MPIRFRCAYCNQLMGIARRKAGTVVRCPKCAGQVIVPAPDPESGVGLEKPANGAGQLFEQSDFEKFFQKEASIPNAGGAPALPRPGPASPPLPVQLPLPNPGFDVEAVPNFDQPYAIGPGIFLSPAKLAIAGAIIVFLLGAAFLVGLLLGRS